MVTQYHRIKYIATQIENFNISGPFLFDFFFYYYPNMLTGKQVNDYPYNRLIVREYPYCSSISIFSKCELNLKRFVYSK